MSKTNDNPNPDSVDAELREQFGKQIDLIIANAEQAAIDDKGMFADMDNNPMNRQTLAREIMQLITQARKEGYDKGFRKASEGALKSQMEAVAQARTPQLLDGEQLEDLLLQFLKATGFGSTDMHVQWPSRSNRRVNAALDKYLPKFTQARKQPEPLDKIDWGVYIHEGKDATECFNLFLKKWLPEHYAHLIDTDDNDGEFMRQKIAQARKGHVPNYRPVAEYVLGDDFVASHTPEECRQEVFERTVAEGKQHQAELDQKVAEALNTVLSAGPKDYVQGQRYLPLFKKGFNTSNGKWREAIAAFLTNPHAPPQEQK